MSGEFLTQTMAPGQIMPFAKAGKYMEVIADGGATFNFNFYGPNGSLYSTWKNVPAGVFLEDPYTTFDVTNNGAGNATMTLMLMDSGRGGSRRQPGVVQVIDSDRATTESGMAFMGLNSTGIPGAGNYGTILLWNPAGSGREVVLESAYIELGATASQMCAGIVTATTGASAGTVPSKLSGGVNSLSQVWTGSIGTDPQGTLIPTKTAWLPNVAANGEGVLKPKRPFVLLPGTGFLIGARTPNALFYGVFEFWEKTLGV
jgi:hypothetical protein